MTTTVKRWIPVGVFATLILLASFFSSSKSTWWLFVIFSIAAGILLVWIAFKLPLTVRTIFVVAILLRLAFIWMPPNLSDDAYRYVWDGRIQNVGENPYLFTPQDAVASGVMPADEVFELLNSKEYYTVYPPASQLIFRAASLASSDWKVIYFLIKILFLLAELTAVWILLKLVSRGVSLLYAWNPAVLIEIGGQPHTEALLVLCLVLTVWYYRKGNGILAAIALTVAGWIKLYPLVMLPLIIRRSGWKALIAVTVTSIILWLPFMSLAIPGNIAESLDLYVRLFEFNAGPYYLVKEIGYAVSGADLSKIIGPAFRWGFLAALPVIYILDRRFKWTYQGSLLVVASLFLLLSTTIHPWYLLGLLILAVVAANDAPGKWHWNWYALSLLSIGTYLLYSFGSTTSGIHDAARWLYGASVIAGWSAFGLLSVLRYGDRILTYILRFRARRKFQLIKSFLAADESQGILDLGSGEGFVGEAVASKTGANVQLADVIDINRSSLPFIRYDGKRLPFQDNIFDTTILYFVLHHADNPEGVLAEAVRVSRKYLIIVESSYTNSINHFALRWLDMAANRLRSRGKMEGAPNFKTEKEWDQVFAESGLQILEKRRRGGAVHRQLFYHLSIV